MLVEKNNRMNNWFECKIKYTKIEESTGKEKQVKEPYLVDAVSFTEAESRMHELMAEELGDEFIVSDLKKVNYTEIFNYEDSEQWYKCKVIFIDVDEKSGREKRTTNHMMVAAKSVKEAHERIEENLQEVLIPYEITSIALTSILDIFPYFNNEEQTEEIPENYKSLGNSQSSENTENPENTEGTESGEQQDAAPQTDSVSTESGSE